MKYLKKVNIVTSISLLTISVREGFSVFNSKLSTASMTLCIAIDGVHVACFRFRVGCIPPYTSPYISSAYSLTLLSVARATIQEPVLGLLNTLQSSHNLTSPEIKQKVGTASAFECHCLYTLGPLVL